MVFVANNPLTRDLMWAVSSPPLLDGVTGCCEWYPAAWYQSLSASAQSIFNQVDESPDELETLLAQQKDQRLGKYFETLWAYWLDRHPRYEVIAQNMAVHDGEKTLGEIDFIVVDKACAKTLHWELAVKFYLGVGNTCVHSNWHGPGKKDRLDKKVEHLVQRQSVLAQQPEARHLLAEQGIVIDGCAVVLKGRLFYPAFTLSPQPAPVQASAAHLRSQWCTLDEFSRQAPEARFMPLLGRGWMAQLPLVEQDCYGVSALLEALGQGHFRLPLQVARLKNDTDYIRIFIVPDDWTHDLAQKNI